MAKKQSAAAAVIAAVAAVIGVLILLFFLTGKKSFDAKTVTDNPAVGFAPTASSQSACESESLVYVEVLWSDFEPREGEYDFAALAEKNHFDKWRAAGKHAVIRFICDVPTHDGHMDIPQWLYDKTADGEFYDTDYGEGYCPNYDNPTFIEAHAKAIAALGEYFSRDNFCLYVELGSLGHWGEWHIMTGEGLPLMPNADVCEQYVKPYVESFKTAKLMMRRPFTFVREYNMGVFNDMTGAEKDTEEWLSWLSNGGEYTHSAIPQALVSINNIWNSAPVGGEFTSSISFEEMLGGSLSETLSLIERSHMSFIGPKCPHKNTDQDEAAVQKVKAQLGYQYRVSKMHKVGSGYTLTWVNDGAAPLYWNWPVYLYSLDENGNVLASKAVDISLSELTPGAEIKTTTMLDGDIIGVGIVDPLTNQPAVKLSMQCEAQGNISIIYSK